MMSSGFGLTFVSFFQITVVDSSNTRDRPRSWPASGSRITSRDSTGPGWGVAGVARPCPRLAAELHLVGRMDNLGK